MNYSLGLRDIKQWALLIVYKYEEIFHFNLIKVLPVPQIRRLKYYFIKSIV